MGTADLVTASPDDEGTGDRAYFRLPGVDWPAVLPAVQDQLLSIRDTLGAVVDPAGPAANATAPAALALQFGEAAAAIFEALSPKERTLRQVITTLRTGLALCSGTCTARMKRRASPWRPTCADYKPTSTILSANCWRSRWRRAPTPTIQTVVRPGPDWLLAEPARWPPQPGPAQVLADTFSLAGRLTFSRCQHASRHANTSIAAVPPVISTPARRLRDTN